MNVYICGDLHGTKASIKNFYENYIKSTPREQEENWIILLGDVGAIYFLNYRDRNFKRDLSKMPFKYFCIRGNHEQRASIIARENPEEWERVELFGGYCLQEKEFPNIYYAADEGDIYNIKGYKCLVIPGAYSVDKHYRLMTDRSWFAQEQLNTEEMENLEKLAQGKRFHFVFSHTCPQSWEPVDLFLGFVDQSTVDRTMEKWMDTLKDKITFDVWCFGHYHADRAERPFAEIMYNEVQNLDDVAARWHEFFETGELLWYFPKSPQFYWD